MTARRALACWTVLCVGTAAVTLGVAVAVELLRVERTDIGTDDPPAVDVDRWLHTGGPITRAYQWSGNSAYGAVPPGHTTSHTWTSPLSAEQADPRPQPAVEQAWADYTRTRRNLWETDRA